MTAPTSHKRTGKTVRAARQLCLFALGCLLFNFPVLALFNKPGSMFGLPILYFYLFAAWAVLIGLLALLMERQD